MQLLTTYLSCVHTVSSSTKSSTLYFTNYITTHFLPRTENFETLEKVKKWIMGKISLFTSILNVQFWMKYEITKEKHFLSWFSYSFTSIKMYSDSRLLFLAFRYWRQFNLNHVIERILSPNIKKAAKILKEISARYSSVIKLIHRRNSQLA